MTGLRNGLPWALVVVSCPCHPPLLAARFSGTAVGSWLARNLLPAALGVTGVFLVSLAWAGAGLVRRPAPAPAGGYTVPGSGPAVDPAAAPGHGNEARR